MPQRAELLNPRNSPSSPRSNCCRANVPGLAGIGRLLLTHLTVLPAGFITAPRRAARNHHRRRGHHPPGSESPPAARQTCSMLGPNQSDAAEVAVQNRAGLGVPPRHDPRVNSATACRTVDISASASVTSPISRGRSPNVRSIAWWPSPIIRRHPLPRNADDVCPIRGDAARRLR